MALLHAVILFIINALSESKFNKTDFRIYDF